MIEVTSNLLPHSGQNFAFGGIGRVARAIAAIQSREGAPSKLRLGGGSAGGARTPSERFRLAPPSSSLPFREIPRTPSSNYLREMTTFRLKHRPGNSLPLSNLQRLTIA
jgi:hypothetical protein